MNRKNVGYNLGFTKTDKKMSLERNSISKWNFWATRECEKCHHGLHHFPMMIFRIFHIDKIHIAPFTEFFPEDKFRKKSVKNRINSHFFLTVVNFQL